MESGSGVCPFPRGPEVNARLSDAQYLRIFPLLVLLVLYCSSHRVGVRLFLMEIRVIRLPNHFYKSFPGFTWRRIRFFSWFIRIGVSINCPRATVCVDQ